uniref:Non-canonical E2 ubiquitin-conjugating enzyme C-terminal domain-containing protein n=1 Tax=Chromera velia CCMP2878 TaxID=1169474 RepID=A0A0G4HK41_9ALVE|eukprot:Cvel_7170.t1-p1 / transcript=Cvel_7170.t1 / gene=Cvel_7170 / organism=Chromera_velia_CCMP2878 / gene_product=UPF0652 protein, putative / transcript_product=UPF0652 protein, putative / location=Cvel_scaffold369:17688-26449(+) / protein_length=699 / sequence_SO=supercontig / SO=protein_coding / is_pseudo=false
MAETDHQEVHDRLVHVLEGEDAALDGAENGDEGEAEGAMGGGQEGVKIENLKPEHIAVWRILPESKKLKLLDELLVKASSEGFSSALQNVGKEEIEALQKITDDQYTTEEGKAGDGKAGGKRDGNALGVDDQEEGAPTATGGGRSVAAHTETSSSVQGDAANGEAEEAAAATASGAAASLTRMGSADSEADALYLNMSRKAKQVPMRLTYDERHFLRLLESALNVSEYTDKIDILHSGGSKARKIGHQIRQVCAILSGLVVAHDYQAGQKLIKERDFEENRDFFQKCFEIGRRYKILNPERMRDSYGKLVYFLMDSRRPEINQLLEFDCVVPVKTVWTHLKERKNGKALLRDPLVEHATKEIMPEGRDRAEIQREIKKKENAIKHLARKYATKKNKKKRSVYHSLYFYSYFNQNDSDDSDDAGEEDGEESLLHLTEDDIEQSLYSLGDHNTFLRFNRQPVDRLLWYMKEFFDPEEAEDRFSLDIRSGRGGARLTHNHRRQFTYVLQTLTLWREVLHEMFILWHKAEADLLSSDNGYILRDTGQGLNRVQAAPQVSRVMHLIVNRVKEKVGGWVGSSVIHLGDHNVPNALMFIDKYAQVPRIVGPLVLCLDKIPDVVESSQPLKKFIDNAYGGVENCQKTILTDFFRHAFDGSGADNFFDAGSCIDGRLTSAWNWCANVEKKHYFPVFLLTGFTGFDGKF